MADRSGAPPSANVGRLIGPAERGRGQANRTAKSSVTLRDVATLAGVSMMTVSNVINGRRGAVGESTRQAVEAAIRELRYRPHSSGRKLRLSQRFSIGMIIVDESPTFLADPFITQLLAGLSNHLNEQGYGLLVQGIVHARLKDALVVRNEETDAICVMLSGPSRVRKQSIGELQQLGQPIVLFQEQAGHKDDVCSIRQQDRLGARDLARHLVGRGARRLAFLAPAVDWPAVEERLRGVREAVHQVEGATVSVVRCGRGDFADTQTAIDSQVQKEGLPDAAIGANDQMGIAALKWAKMRGLAVPGDFLVTGFNAFDFWQYSDPVLTSVQSPAYAMGQRGGAALLDRLERGAFVDRDIVFPVRFLLGSSA